MPASSNGLVMTVTKDNMSKLEMLESAIKQELRDYALPRIGKLIEARIVRHVQAQDLNWAELNEKYKKWKERKGYSTATWIMTSTLVANITSVVNKESYEVFVGVLRSAGNHIYQGGSKNPQPMFEIASILEGVHPDGQSRTGSRITARPLFRPSLEESKRSVETVVGVAIRKAKEKVEG